MAIKDLFNNFFEFTDEEEVVEEPEQYREKESQKPSQSRTPQATQSNSNFSANQSELRSVPNRRSSRNQNNEERNYRMNTLSKSGSKTSLLWINHQTIRHKKVLKCVYLNHVSFLIHKILQTN